VIAHRVYPQLAAEASCAAESVVASTHAKRTQARFAGGGSTADGRRRFGTAEALDISPADASVAANFVTTHPE
jgi:hypothetical protein